VALEVDDLIASSADQVVVAMDHSVKPGLRAWMVNAANHPEFHQRAEDSVHSPT